MPHWRRLVLKTVINLIGDEDFDSAEQREVESRGMRYVHIPMTTHEPPTPAQQGLFLSIVNAAEHQPVYVHCVGGRHRTGVMTAVYRMTNDGLTGKQAFTEMKRFKYGFDFLHPEFKQFVPRVPGCRPVGGSRRRSPTAIGSWKDGVRARSAAGRDWHPTVVLECRLYHGESHAVRGSHWLRGRDLNPRPLGYEPNELPDCSTPRQKSIRISHRVEALR